MPCWKSAHDRDDTVPLTISIFASHFVKCFAFCDANPLISITAILARIQTHILSTKQSELNFHALNQTT